VRGLASQYKPPARAIATGRVSTHARAISRTVSGWMPDRLAHIVPATPLERTWVVLTGMPRESAMAIVEAATSSAAPPWA
jgi:hypothetical protein